MSQISDVGVAFKFSGADSFESRLKSLESQWKSFSGSFNQTPEINKHFDKMTTHLATAEKKITKSLNVIKTAAVGLMAAKAGGGLFDWLIGSEATSDAKSFNNWVMGENRLKEYESTMARLREEHKIDKPDLLKGVYQIDSAMAGKPIEQSLNVLETLPYYMKLTGKTFEESAKFVKQFYASFGDSLPVKEQAEYAKTTLAQLLKVAQISKSDPIQVADTLGRLGSLYSSMGFKQSEMFADVSSLTPRLGGRPEIAATAINAILPNSSKIAQELAKADFEQAFAQGRAFDESGRSSRNWGSLENLKDRAAERNKQAVEDLAELERSSARYGEKAGIKAQKFLNNRDRHGLMGYLGELIEKSRDNPLAQKILKDALGEQYNAGLAWIEDFKRKEIQRLENEYNNVSGSNAMQSGKTAIQKELPHKASTLKQASEDFQANLRSVFYEPMQALLEEWKNILLQINKSFAGEAGAQKLKALGGSLVGGVKESMAPGGNAPDSKTPGQMFQEWVTSLNGEDFRNAGKTIGQAANDFLAAASLLKRIVTAVHDKYQQTFPLDSGPKKENQVSLLWDSFRFDPNKSVLGWLWRGAPTDDNTAKSAPQANMLTPEHRATPLLAAPTSATGNNGMGSVQGSFVGDLKMGAMTLEVDGQGVATAVVRNHGDILSGYIRGELEKDADRNRGNATDKPLMAN